ncbi:sugar/nucleoside kinase (ribokinase family) [Crossiella equi]|uniref:Sugar/nucleoside kinase (Ribokinase family) n=1 Tax=Crossiella equi TaxID=130796 RepID=A0ABS5AAF1_9PSEU|nr:PfkB family carbohydrate kinase [Crossiella equi]MBP2473558.1 sugar/nucleoside kinase (ribokinase family) [Crossiella equi]
MARIVVVGDAGLDVVARHDGPLVHGGDTRSAVRMVVGGAGANTAAWLAHVGAEAVLIGRVGDDIAGHRVRAELGAAGVTCALTVDESASTCCVVVLVDEHGQRTMLPDRGAIANLCPADISPEALLGADHLHLSGYVLLDESSRAAGVAALAAARAAGLTTSVDPQAATLIARLGTAEFLELVAGADLLLPNTDELAVLTGSTDPESARALLDVVGAVVATSGDGGAHWVAPGGTVNADAPVVDCVDSTGAGDAFNAGLLATWRATGDIPEALAAGVAAGAGAVQLVGAQPPGLVSAKP